MAHPVSYLYCNILMCILMVKSMGKEVTHFCAFLFISIILGILVCEVRVIHTFVMSVDNTLAQIFGAIRSSNITRDNKTLITDTINNLVDSFKYIQQQLKD